MSAVDQHAEAHRLKNELGYGARRIGRELGITRYAAEQLLDQPLPTRRDPRLEAIISAIVATVPHAVIPDTTVTIEYAYEQAGHPSKDSWTGTAVGLAERIFDALYSSGGEPQSPSTEPDLVLHFRGELAERIGRQLAYAAHRLASEGGA
ncbi:hypothetical protein ACWEQ7_02935 [Streptomyces sp. NPDC004069]